PKPPEAQPQLGTAVDGPRKHKKKRNRKGRARREEQRDEPARLSGRVIDVETRHAVPLVAVRVLGTSFRVETEPTGVFFWNELPRQTQLQIEFTHKEYRPQTVPYRSTKDDEQYLVVKMAPKQSRAEKKRSRRAAWDG
ncbi:MAG: hypothetical protein HY815_32020, partial [Candidatus Riflebacteria bacterium]|nr:hypothetical protein [Candidatus Riflebacteria bacterium]